MLVPLPPFLWISLELLTWDHHQWRDGDRVRPPSRMKFQPQVLNKYETNDG